MSKQPSRDMLIKNLRAMKMPTQLLKFGASGKPKFKDFQLSDDNRYLAWSSQTKAADLTRVALSDIKEVRFGQRTEKFQRNNRKDLEHLSFSVIYYAKPDPTMKNPPAGMVEDSLDLVCKDDKEFDVWATTLVLISQGKITDDVWIAVQKDQQDAGQHTRSPTSMMNSPSSTQVEAGVGLPNAFKEPNDLYTFGWSEWGQTANSDNADASTVSQPKLVETLLGKGVVSVACGWSHTSILLETGAVLQVGNRLATGLAEDFFTPMPTELTEKHAVIAVACGSFHSMALTEKGEVYTWGCNLHGQLGHGDNKDVAAPTVIKSLKDRGLKKIAAGHYTSAAVAEDGTMFTWGFGEHGALGHNDTNDCLEPTIVEDLNGTDIVRIAVGGSHMFACTTRETYAWGWNACGQLGLGHEEDQHRPHVVETLRGSSVSAIAAGAAHSIAVVMVAKIGHRVVYTWGSNSCGQLGQDKKAHVNKPTAVASFNTGFSDAGESASIEIIEVACGDLHTVVRTANGNIYACGSNTYGQLGVGHTNDVPEFKIIPSFREKGPRAIACGGEHSCVLTARAWVADHEAKDCMSCKSVFNFVNRKHHCRNCGGVFCGSCTTKRIAILKYGVTEPVRVCDECYKKLGGR